MKTFNAMTTYLRETFANRRKPEYARAAADLFWKCALAVSAAIAAVSVGIGIMEAQSALASLQAAPADAPQSAPLNRAQLETVLAAFSARTADFRAATSSAADAGVLDPSQR